MRVCKVWLMVAMLWVPVLAQAQVSNECGCIDLVLVVDDTASMGGAIANLQAGLSNVVAAANLVSAGEARFGLITFSDTIDVDRPLTNSVEAMQAAVDALVPAGGAGVPEASDEAMKLAVTGAASAGCVVNSPLGPLGAYRPECTKILVLVTDALPGGCDDTFVAGVDDVNAAAVAASAGAAGMRISAVQVGGAAGGVLGGIMQEYADATGGPYTVVPADGTGAAAAIQTILANCGQFSPPETFLPSTRPQLHDGCITRSARYWFTHPVSDDPDCATLLRAIQASGDSLLVGFLGLPVEFRNGDAVKDEVDAMIEALGFYWRGPNVTGEHNGTQSARILASPLCRERKRLAAEVIAALANNALLGTQPSNCAYRVSGTMVPFPGNLIEQAGQVLAGEDLVAIRAMRVLVAKFNVSGVIPDFALGLKECPEVDRRTLRDAARDPTTESTCPAINDTCNAAKSLVSFPHSETIALSRYHDNLGGPNCATGGREAIWRISPPVAAAGRQFTVSTFDSNFDTAISILKGACNPLNVVACNDDGTITTGTQTAIRKQSQVTFTTDGTDTYFIVVDGVGTAMGRLKLRVISH